MKNLIVSSRGVRGLFVSMFLNKCAVAVGDALGGEALNQAFIPRDCKRCALLFIWLWSERLLTGGVGRLVGRNGSSTQYDIFSFRFYVLLE